MPVSPRRAAIFLDRDGTLIEDKGYIHSTSQVTFYSNTVSSLERLQNRYLLFIVTNQPGIGLGILSSEQVERVNRFITSRLAEAGITVTAVYCCPHTQEEGCDCRKPSPYFLRRASEAFNVDLKRSFVVGDHPSDVELAQRSGTRGVFVLTGHGQKHVKEIPKDSRIFVTGDLDGAVTRILSQIFPSEDQGEEIGRAAEIIRKGGLVAFPTETVYGLGADTFSPLAVARIFEVKGRPYFDPLIVHVAGQEDLNRLVQDVPPQAKGLIDRFWPGPLTVVLFKREEVPDIVTAGLPSVAVRMPSHPLALRLIEEARRPIAAPSANPFGYLSPTTADHVREQLGDQVDLVLDGGACSVGVESTILSFLEETPKLLRPGGLPLEEIEEMIGKVEIGRMDEDRPLSPGMFPRHYAPRTRIVIGQDENASRICGSKRVGILAFRKRKTPGFGAVEFLSRDGDLREAAANLFAAIRRLDALDLDVIVADPIPEVGLGRAIMDRLRRASTTED
jgi:L-threonylcarbamoyladenylate synthase